ncbi:hypothetical protein TanjilG_23187 [Lupinus angustifolius]|uniref:Uncharacterized protein n=1 Tax=Lupinus angustifolius TaxID=3871 RepID=A0A394DBS0_LUPAN|nr:hypothetical protein TanjilG_23187 [Lupinus angustifolius]
MGREESVNADNKDAHEQLPLQGAQQEEIKWSEYLKQSISSWKHNVEPNFSVYLCG